MWNYADFHNIFHFICFILFCVCLFGFVCQFILFGLFFLFVCFVFCFVLFCFVCYCLFSLSFLSLHSLVNFFSPLISPTRFKRVLQEQRDIDDKFVLMLNNSLTKSSSGKHIDRAQECSGLWAKVGCYENGCYSLFFISHTHTHTHSLSLTHSLLLLLLLSLSLSLSLSLYLLFFNLIQFFPSSSNKRTTSASQRLILVFSK